MRKLLLSLALIMLSFESLYAVGALYARRPLSNESGTPLALVSYDATVTITDQIAVTHVDHLFRNESSNRLEGIFVFPLPEGAVVTELALWINGERVIGDVMERDTARAVYESIVRKSIDPALLEYMGDNVFKLSVFPIDPVGYKMSERRIEITYAELLPYTDEQVAYTFFMKTANLSSKPVQRASVSGTLQSQKKLVTVSSPSHTVGTQLAINRQDDLNYTFVYGYENSHSGNDLVLSFRFDESSFALNNLIYLPDEKQPMFFDEAGDDGYFLLWVTPPQAGTESPILPKSVALVADVSGSMSGTRMVQLRKSLHAMLDMLTERDRFSLLAFSTGVSQFKDDMVIATSENKEAAHTFIDGLSQEGLTNYEDALRSALKCTWIDSGINVMVFFTDGKPTWPVETNATKIHTIAKEFNNNDVSICSFGVGDDLDKSILQSLSSQNNGTFCTITSDEAISSTLSAFMKRISYPLLKDLSIDYGAIKQYDIFPRNFQALFSGEQLTVLGRFQAKLATTVKFIGNRGTEPVSIQQEIAFDTSRDDHPFVPRMWASAKIDYLVDEIAVLGEQKELVNQIKELGKKYSIITQYTSMLVLEPGVPVLEDKTAKKPVSHSFTVTTDLRSRRVIFRYSLPYSQKAQRIVLRIFDARGKLVRKLVNEVVAGGNFMAQWDCRSDAGSVLASGTYIAVLTSGSSRQIARIPLTR